MPPGDFQQSTKRFNRISHAPFGTQNDGEGCAITIFFLSGGAVAIVRLFTCITAKRRSVSVANEQSVTMTTPAVRLHIAITLSALRAVLSVPIFAPRYANFRNKPFLLQPRRSLIESPKPFLHPLTFPFLFFLFSSHLHPCASPHHHVFSPFFVPRLSRAPCRRNTGGGAII